MDDHDDNRLIDAVLASGVKIPPLPAMLTQILALEHDDNAGPREFAALVGRDPALSGALFRVAGSPVFGLRAKQDSLEKVVTVLGIRTTVAVARSEGLRLALHDPALARVMNALWEHMNAVADIVLETLRAARIKGVREDQAFLAAMFHDCGVALLCRREAAYAAAFERPAAWPDALQLDALHATSHTVVGLMVARSWQLPAEVALAVRHHHDSDLGSLPEAVRKTILLIQFACHVLARRQGGDDSAWDNVWKPLAVDLFANSAADLDELERRFFD
jgi:HD-like signal output (HDOD) protein